MQQLVFWNEGLGFESSACCCWKMNLRLKQFQLICLLSHNYSHLYSVMHWFYLSFKFKPQLVELFRRPIQHVVLNLFRSTNRASRTWTRARRTSWRWRRSGASCRRRRRNGSGFWNVRSGSRFTNGGCNTWSLNRSGGPESTFRLSRPNHSDLLTNFVR